jgi:hypothetical protein
MVPAPHPGQCPAPSRNAAGQAYGHGRPLVPESGIRRRLQPAAYQYETLRDRTLLRLARVTVVLCGMPGCRRDGRRRARTTFLRRLGPASFVPDDAACALVSRAEVEARRAAAYRRVANRDMLVVPARCVVLGTVISSSMGGVLYVAAVIWMRT